MKFDLEVSVELCTFAAANTIIANKCYIDVVYYKDGDLLLRDVVGDFVYHSLL